MKADLLFQIGFFQHERLIHLLVTLCFAIMTVIVMLFSFFRQDILILLFLLLLLLLLMPYIRHYFILENGVQKLYTFYDRLCDEERTKK